MAHVIPVKMPFITVLTEWHSHDFGWICNAKQTIYALGWGMCATNRFGGFYKKAHIHYYPAIMNGTAGVLLNDLLVTVFEDWFTPASIGDTSDFYYFTFSTAQEAYAFIAELVMKFNSPWQQVLFRATERLCNVTLNATCKEIDKLKAESKKIASKQKRHTPKLTPTQATALETPEKRVYVFDMGNGTVKIGVSKNIEQRRRTIQNSSGQEIFCWCYTDTFRDYRAYEIESECHTLFAPYRTRGEFFRIPYEQARKKLQSYGKVFNGNIKAT